MYVPPSLCYDPPLPAPLPSPSDLSVMNYFNSGPPYVCLQLLLNTFHCLSFLCLWQVENRECISTGPPLCLIRTTAGVSAQRGQDVVLEKVFWIGDRNDSCLKVLAMTGSISLTYFIVYWWKWSWISHFTGMERCKIKMESWRLRWDKNYTRPIRLSVDPRHRFIWQVSYVLNITLHFQKKTCTAARH